LAPSDKGIGEMSRLDEDNISWLDTYISLFLCAASNEGIPRTFRQILFSDFAVPHKWFFPTAKFGITSEDGQGWLSGVSSDLDAIIDIRTRATDKEKDMLKLTLLCYTPSGNHKNKQNPSKPGTKYELLHTTNVMQLDFDKLEKHGIDCRELQRHLFNLPFVGYCGLSVSGKGIFALILIAEPDKLTEYAGHFFNVFTYHYKIPIDTSKGSNRAGLRFMSYDCNALYREDPQPVYIANPIAWEQKKTGSSTAKTTAGSVKCEPGLLTRYVQDIQEAIPGNRQPTINRICFNLGGYDNNEGLEVIKQAIRNSPQYTDSITKYLNDADLAFADGQTKKIVK
jgi:hypothetical protein